MLDIIDQRFWWFENDLHRGRYHHNRKYHDDDGFQTCPALKISCRLRYMSHFLLLYLPDTGRDFASWWHVWPKTASMPKRNPPLNRPQMKWSTVIVRVRRPLSWQSVTSFNAKQAIDRVFHLIREILHSSERLLLELAAQFVDFVCRTCARSAESHSIPRRAASPTSRLGHLVSCRIYEDGCSVCRREAHFLEQIDQGTVINEQLLTMTFLQNGFQWVTIMYCARESSSMDANDTLIDYLLSTTSSPTVSFFDGCW